MRRRSSRQDPTPPSVLECTPIEEEFFRTGDALAEAPSARADTASEARPSRWRALIAWLRGARAQHAD